MGINRSFNSSNGKYSHQILRINRHYSGSASLLYNILASPLFLGLVFVYLQAVAGCAVTALIICTAKTYAFII